MEEHLFYPSEVARLVLGYLKEVKCDETWHAFLTECTDLQEHHRLFKEGKVYPTNVEGKSLLCILGEYCTLTRGGESKNVHANIPENSKTNNFCTPEKNNFNSMARYTINQKIRTKSVYSSMSIGKNVVRPPPRSLFDPSLPFSPGSAVTCHTPRRSRINTTLLNFGACASVPSKETKRPITSETPVPVTSAITCSSAPAAASLAPTTSTCSPTSNPSPLRTKSSSDQTLNSLNLTPNKVGPLILQNKKKLNILPNSPTCSSPRIHSSSPRNINDPVDPLSVSINAENTPDVQTTPSTSGQCKNENENTENNEIIPISCNHSLDSTPKSTFGLLDQTGNSICEENRNCSPGKICTLSTVSESTSIIYNGSEIALNNESRVISSINCTKTPESVNDPPPYSRAPATNSPRLILSFDRSLEASLTTPLKEWKNWNDEFRSPRRKSLIPRRRLLSELSPSTKQNQPTDTHPLGSVSDDTSDNLAILEELFNYPPLVQKLADNINMAKFSGENSSQVECPKTLKCPAPQDVPVSDDIIKDILARTEADPVFDEYISFLSGRGDYCKDGSDYPIMQDSMLTPSKFPKGLQGEITGFSHTTNKQKSFEISSTSSLGDVPKNSKDILNQQKEIAPKITDVNHDNNTFCEIDLTLENDSNDSPLPTSLICSSNDNLNSLSSSVHLNVASDRNFGTDLNTPISSSASATVINANYEMAQLHNSFQSNSNVNDLSQTTSTTTDLNNLNNNQMSSGSTFLSHNGNFDTIPVQQNSFVESSLCAAAPNQTIPGSVPLVISTNNQSVSALSQPISSLNNVGTSGLVTVQQTPQVIAANGSSGVFVLPSMSAGMPLVTSGGQTYLIVNTDMGGNWRMNNFQAPASSNYVSYQPVNNPMIINSEPTVAAPSLVQQPGISFSQVNADNNILTVNQPAPENTFLTLSPSKISDLITFNPPFANSQGKVTSNPQNKGSQSSSRRPKPHVSKQPPKNLETKSITVNKASKPPPENPETKSITDKRGRGRNKKVRKRRSLFPSPPSREITVETIIVHRIPPPTSTPAVILSQESQLLTQQTSDLSVADEMCNEDSAMITEQSYNTLMDSMFKHQSSVSNPLLAQQPSLLMQNSQLSMPSILEPEPSMPLLITQEPSMPTLLTLESPEPPIIEKPSLNTKSSGQSNAKHDYILDETLDDEFCALGEQDVTYKTTTLGHSKKGVSKANNDTKTAMELFSLIIGQKQLQSPPLKALISSAKFLAGEGGRLNSPHIRTLNFEEAEQLENSAKTSKVTVTSRAKKSSDSLTAKPSEKSTGTPSVKSTGRPSVKSNRRPSGKSTASPVKKSTASPVKKSTSPVKKSASPVKKSTSPVKKSTASPVKKSTSPVKKSTASPVKKSTANPSIKSTANPSNKSTVSPAGKSTGSPSDISTASPADKSTASPSDKLTSSPSDKSTANPSGKLIGSPSDILSKTPLGNKVMTRQSSKLAKSSSKVTTNSPPGLTESPSPELAENLSPKLSNSSPKLSNSPTKLSKSSPKLLNSSSKLSTNSSPKLLNSSSKLSTNSSPKLSTELPDKMTTKKSTGKSPQNLEKLAKNISDAVTENSSGKMALKKLVELTSKSSSKFVANPSDELDSKPSDKLATELPDKMDSKRSDKLASKPSDKLSSKSSDKVASKPSDKLDSESSDKLDSESLDKLASKPSDELASKPSDELASKPSNEFASKSGKITKKSSNSFKSNVTADLTQRRMSPRIQNRMKRKSTPLPNFEVINVEPEVTKQEHSRSVSPIPRDSTSIQPDVLRDISDYELLFSAQSEEFNNQATSPLKLSPPPNEYFPLMSDCSSDSDEVTHEQSSQHSEVYKNSENQVLFDDNSLKTTEQQRKTDSDSPSKRNSSGHLNFESSKSNSPKQYTNIQARSCKKKKPDDQEISTENKTMQRLSPRKLVSFQTEKPSCIETPKSFIREETVDQFNSNSRTNESNGAKNISVVKSDNSKIFKKQETGFISEKEVSLNSMSSTDKPENLSNNTFVAKRRVLPPPKKRIVPVKVDSTSSPTWSVISMSPYKQGSSPFNCTGSIIWPLDTPIRSVESAKTPSPPKFANSPINFRQMEASPTANVSNKNCDESFSSKCTQKLPDSGENQAKANSPINVQTLNRNSNKSIGDLRDDSQNSFKVKSSVESVPKYSSGKPKAMADFYLSLKSDHVSELPISPGTISSSSCTVDTFLRRLDSAKKNLNEPDILNTNSSQRSDSIYQTISEGPFSISQFIPSNPNPNHYLDNYETHIISPMSSPIVKTRKRKRIKLDSSPEATPVKKSNPDFYSSPGSSPCSTPVKETDTGCDSLSITPSATPFKIPSMSDSNSKKQCVTFSDNLGPITFKNSKSSEKLDNIVAKLMQKSTSVPLAQSVTLKPGTGNERSFDDDFQPSTVPLVKKTTLPQTKSSNKKSKNGARESDGLPAGIKMPAKWRKADRSNYSEAIKGTPKTKKLVDSKRAKQNKPSNSRQIDDHARFKSVECKKNKPTSSNTERKGNQTSRTSGQSSYKSKREIEVKKISFNDRNIKGPSIRSPVKQKHGISRPPKDKSIEAKDIPEFSIECKKAKFSSSNKDKTSPVHASHQSLLKSALIGLSSENALKVPRISPRKQKTPTPVKILNYSVAADTMQRFVDGDSELQQAINFIAAENTVAAREAQFSNPCFESPSHNIGMEVVIGQTPRTYGARGPGSSLFNIHSESSESSRTEDFRVKKFGIVKDLSKKSNR